MDIFRPKESRFFSVPPGAYRFSGLSRIKKTKNKWILHKQIDLFTIFFTIKKRLFMIERPETLESRVRRPGSLEWDALEASSETPWCLSLPRPLLSARNIDHRSSSCGVIASDNPSRSAACPSRRAARAARGRLTRDHKGVSLAITRPTGCDFRKFRKIDFPEFFVKNPEKSGKSVFRIPRTKIKFWIFDDFLYARYFLYKPSFPSS